MSLVSSYYQSLALTYEHAWADGVPNLRYLNMIGAQLQKESQINQTMLYRRGAINEIKFNLDAKAASYINQAETSHANAKKDLTISLCVAGAAPILDNASFFSNDEIERAKSLSLSRNWFQQHRIGSDGFIQLSYQIAYRLIHDDTVSVYEGKGLGPVNYISKHF